MAAITQRMIASRERSAATVEVDLRWWRLFVTRHRLLGALIAGLVATQIATVTGVGELCREIEHVPHQPVALVEDHHRAAPAVAVG